MYFFHSGKNKLENTDCQPKVKDPQSQEEEDYHSKDYLENLYDEDSKDEYDNDLINVTKSIDLDQNSDEENNPKEDGEESLYDWNIYLDKLHEEYENISDSNEAIAMNYNEYTNEDDKEDDEEEDSDKSNLKDTQFHLDSAIGKFNQKLYDELDKNENGNIIFSPFRYMIYANQKHKLEN